jgi:Tfp pilus assembly protein FimT
VTIGTPAPEPAGHGLVRQARPAGASIIELIVALGLAITVSSVALPSLLAGVDAYRAGHAARYLAGSVRHARGRAIAAGRYAAMQFSSANGAASWATYADGNRNGVRTADVTRGIDLLLEPPTRLADIAQGVRFALNPGTPDVDGRVSASADGIRLGSGNWLSFSPSGTSSSGTIYLAGPGRQQYAVRVLGPTGRLRLLRYDSTARTWVTP